MVHLMISYHGAYASIRQTNTEKLILRIYALIHFALLENPKRRKEKKIQSGFINN
jgi:hypothetical protein